MDGFPTFGTQHLVMLGVFVAGVPLAARWGRAVRGTAAQRRTCRVLAVGVAAVLVPLQLLDFLPGQYDLATTLPLQLCDLAAVAAVVALWSGNRHAVALTYYWGLLLTTQGVLTPALDSAFPSVKFLGFWALHLLVAWSAVLLTFGLRLTPTWADWVRTVLTTLVWAGGAYAFSVATGTNYGFLVRKPEGSVLDLLGPWPVYVAEMALVVLVLWALMTWPWTRRTRSRSTSGESGVPPTDAIQS